MQRRFSWSFGGAGLVMCGAVDVVGDAVASPGVKLFLGILGALLWAVGILVLGWGLGWEASVVARRPLGLLSSIVVAVWPLVETVVSLLGAGSRPEQARGWVAWDYASLAILAAAALIASVQVARAGVVPTPWNRVPLWVLGAQAVCWIVPQLIGVASPTTLIEFADLMTALGTIGFLLATFGLGFVALLLSVSESSRSESTR